MDDELMKPSTMKELALKYATVQPHMVDNLLEEAPVLEQVKYQKATHGLWNVYSKATNVQGAGFVDMNAPLPQMSFDRKLEKVDLSIMGGELFCPEDTAKQYGGHNQYFAERQPRFLRDAGVNTEKVLIYKNYRQFALDNENVQNAGATGSGYSILCVRHIPGEICGLYSPEGFKQGAMLDVQAINNGGLYHNKEGVLGYGVRLKGYFGFQLANEKAVSAIVNIDRDHVPTEEQMDELLIGARANPGTTHLYMHPKVLNMLNKYKGSILRTVNSDSEINRTFDQWNKIKIITSYNFMDGTETNVAF